MKNIIWSIGYKLRINNIVKAKNCYLYDSSGRQYLDLESGVWCTNVGHCNSEVNKTIKFQIDQIVHTGYCYANPIIEITAKKILQLVNMEGGKCEFICSGSEAVEYGMRISKTITKQPLTLAFSDSYFGAYGMAQKKEKKEWVIYDWQNCSCDSSTCIGECKEFNNLPFEKIGVFLFEPGSSSGLIRFPSKSIIKKISNKIKNNNGVVVVNEITTGVGRTGKWFGFQHYDLQPDIVAIGKGIGNGYPVSIAVITEEVSKKLEKVPFLYSQSHQNDPLGTSIANKVIDIVKEEDLINRSNSLGEKITKYLNKLKNKSTQIKEVRGRGLMIAIELYENASFIQNKLFEDGFILTKRNNSEVLRIDPALTIEEKDLDRFLKRLSELLET